jgi:hypothetical protein
VTFTVLNLPDDDRTLIGLARVSTDAQDAYATAREFPAGG